uniref:Transposase n=1 Tax=Caenorhabditis tropicalis TaxID=1561998 RepID=A0A1I7UL36_9PELO
MTTYIVIEISENDNALDILNVLMTQTKSRFTITKEIGEYAAEREQLKRVKTQEKDKFVSPTSSSLDCIEILEPPKKNNVLWIR